MIRDGKGILLITGGYAAAVIGAGFASGREIISYFVKYGKGGIIGIITACVIFSVFAYTVLSVCVKYNITSYKKFISTVFKTCLGRNLANATVFICAAASLCVMTACMGEVGNMSLGLYKIVGGSVLCLCLGSILLMNMGKGEKISSVMGAVIVVGVVFTCFYILRFREHQTVSVITSGTVSGISYAGYNIIGTGAVLAGMSRLIKSGEEALAASVASGLVLFIMIVLMSMVLGIYYGQIDMGEIPMLKMALRQSKLLGVLYGVFLSLAVLTTAVSNGFALLDMIGDRMTKKSAVLWITLTALALSGMGFGPLVDTVYRICGYIGAAVAFGMIYKAFTKQKGGF